jgi:hypothetical protein
MATTNSKDKSNNKKGNGKNTKQRQEHKGNEKNKPTSESSDVGTLFLAAGLFAEVDGFYA